MESLPFILRWEGGFVDGPDDPGGRTNKGVTQKTYSAWRSRRGLLPSDVKRRNAGQWRSPGRCCGCGMTTPRGRNRHT